MPYDHITATEEEDLHAIADAWSQSNTHFTEHWLLSCILFPVSVVICIGYSLLKRNLWALSFILITLIYQRVITQLQENEKARFVQSLTHHEIALLEKLPPPINPQEFFAEWYAQNPRGHIDYETPEYLLETAAKDILELRKKLKPN